MGKQEARAAVWLTSLSVGLYWISLYLYVPTLPIYTQQLTSDLAMVGTVLSQYGLWQAVIRLPLGIASDRIGLRKPFIFLGFALSGLGAWLMGSAETVNGVLVGRAVTGFAAGSWVVMVVAFSNLFPLKDAVRATALLTLVNSASRVLATGVTGVINDWGGYRLAFWLSAITAGAAALAYLPVKEQRQSKTLPTFWETGSLLIRRDVLLPAILNAVTQYAAYATTFGFLPILAKQLGASNVAQSLLVSMNIAMGLAGNLATTSLVRRMGSRSLVLAGFMFIATGIVALWLADSVVYIFIAQILLGFGGGMAYPTLMGMSIEHVEGAARSTAMGLHQAVYALGMFGGPWLSGILADWMGVQAMFAVTAVVILVSGLWGYRMMRQKPIAVVVNTKAG